MRQIIDRLCKGSVEELVSGVAEAKVLSKVDSWRLWPRRLPVDIPSGCHPFNLGRTFASWCDRASPAATPGRFEVSGPSETRAILSN